MTVGYEKKVDPDQTKDLETPEVRQSTSSLRIIKARDRMLNAVPTIDLERAKLITESYMKTEGEPLVIRKAKSFLEQCQQKTCFIQEGELIIGNPGSMIRAGLPSPDASWKTIDDEINTISTRPQDPFHFPEDQKKLFLEFIKPYWSGKSFYEAWLARAPEELLLLDRARIMKVGQKAQDPSGAAPADYQWLINVGVKGIREKIEGKLSSLDMVIPCDYDKITYLKSLLIVCDGMVTLANRYARVAEEMADGEKNPHRKTELEEMAKICRWVPENPARTFWEAIQSFWFYQICLLMENHGLAYSPGRMDQYLYPYYKKDREEGRITKDQAQELLDCVWVKFSEIVKLFNEATAITSAGYGASQNVICGGITKEGLDAVNDVSYMMLQATKNVRLYEPRLSVRYNKGKNPDLFLHKIAEVISLGMGFPAIYNDDNGIKMLLDRGASLEDAYNWNAVGCVEPTIQGKMYQWAGVGHINLGCVVELVLLNGKNRLAEEDLSLPKTGDPRNFETFDDFKTAIKTQWAYLVRKMAEAAQVLEQMSGELRPFLTASLTFEDCIENATDWQCGGAKYNSAMGFFMTGVADIINSLATVKKLIYDEKKLRWNELLQALDNDFEGYEEIRQMCLAVPKWGNDIENVDEIGTELFNFAAEEIRKYRGRTGGKMMPAIIPVSANTPMGWVIGALPSGRKAWQPLADGISPMQGTDTSGPTAVLKSVSKLNHTLYTQGTLLNMRLDLSLFKDEKGISHLMNLVKSVCDLGIYHIQFNVVSNETLRAAQKEPEKYRDLLVRVAGYSAFFVELSKPVQDDIMSRNIHQFV